MTDIEIKAREMIIEQIDKLIEKNQKKATKEREKVSNASITYKGDVYTSEADIQDAYACDCFSSATYDKLLEKLNVARGKNDPNAMTQTEQLLHELYSIKYNLEREIMQDRAIKEKQEAKDKRVRELAEEGYSINEIECIIGNEELMRFE